MSFARKRARFSRKAEEKAMLREQQYNNAEEGERMSGKCRPRDTGLYTVEGAVTISLSTRQIWSFKYGALNGKTVVKVNRDNVRLYLKKEDFECDWEIIEKAEG